MTYDPKVYDLASYFLGDGTEKEEVSGLAQHIQFQIELWLGDYEGKKFSGPGDV